MTTKSVNGKDYALPSQLSPFQEEMYIHLIDWKWRNLTMEKGKHNFKGKEYFYDAILPEPIRASFPIIHKSILTELSNHHKVYSFKFHKHFHHMVSSQAANVNLFLPLLDHPMVDSVLKLIKKDFKRLNIRDLFNGYCIEYWGPRNGSGLLGDHSNFAGTDSDIAISYYNHNDEKCLWLIEHKLTEQEFTQCGGCKSKGRDKSKHLCDKSFADILSNKNLCYYHDIRKFEYWNLTDKNQSFFPNHAQFAGCPFKKGMNQLWRNQLLGLALENTGAYNHVYFSVVRHPGNKALDKSINDYQKLTNSNPKFSVFTSLDVINAASTIGDPGINDWIAWYKCLYKI